MSQVEFPSAGLTAAQGDGDGQNEMNWSMGYLRQYLNAWQDQAAGIRVCRGSFVITKAKTPTLTAGLGLELNHRWLPALRANPGQQSNCRQLSRPSSGSKHARVN